MKEYTIILDDEDVEMLEVAEYDTVEEVIKNIINQAAKQGYEHKEA